MNSKIKILTMSIIASTLLVGCGSSDSDDTTTSSSTSTGTYLDSAVNGVPFCEDGVSMGNTDENGKFTYTPGTTVTFGLGSCVDGKGIILKTLSPADTNKNTIEIVETNASVASLLQSLDSDGNASNGITIIPELNNVIANAAEGDNLSAIGLNNLNDFNTTKLKAADANLSSALANAKDVNKTTALEHVMATIDEKVTDPAAKAEALESLTKTIETENLSTELSTKLVETFKDDLNTTDSDALKGALISMTETLNINDTTFTEAIEDFKEAINDTNNSAVATVLDNLNTALKDTQNISLKDTLSTAKTTLTNSGTQDDKLLAAVLDIVSIVDSPDIQSFASSSFDIDTLIDENLSAKIELAQNISLANGTDALHDLATRLKNASDAIDAAFTSKYKVFNYTIDDNNISMNYNQSLAIRSGALATASTLEYLASYSYGKFDYIQDQEKTIEGHFAWNKEIVNASVATITGLPDTNQTTFNYATIDTDPATVFNDPTFYALTNSTRLQTAGTYLKDSALLLTTIDDNNTVSTEDAAEALKIYNAMRGVDDGNYTSGYMTVNLPALYNPATALDRNDFPSNFEYQNDNNQSVSIDSTWSIIAQGPVYYAGKEIITEDGKYCFYVLGDDAGICSYKEDSNSSYPELDYVIRYKGADFNPTFKPTRAVSNIDDILLKVPNDDNNGSITPDFSDLLAD